MHTKKNFIVLTKWKEITVTFFFTSIRVNVDTLLILFICCFCQRFIKRFENMFVETQLETENCECRIVNGMARLFPLPIGLCIVGALLWSLLSSIDLFRWSF